MSPRILLALLLLAACAGPSAHQTRAASQPEAVRPVVASTLGPDDPLAASNCGLPTAPGSPCTDVATEPEEKEVGDEHHEVVRHLLSPADVLIGALRSEDKAGTLALVLALGEDTCSAAHLLFIVVSAGAGTVKPDDDRETLRGVPFGITIELVEETIL